MKRLLSFVLSAMLVFSHAAVFAKDLAKEWAVPHFQYLEEFGVKIEESENGGFADDIKRLQFAEIMNSAYEAYLGESVDISDAAPFYDTISPDAAALYVLGIVTGDENQNFNPDNEITRQEAAKMLYGFCFVLKEERLEKDDKVVESFSDRNEIAPWAKNAVGALAKMEIMRGKDDNKFCPRDNLTIEEAVTLISRVMQLERETEAEKDEVIEEEKESSEPTLEPPEKGEIAEEKKTETIFFNELPDSEEYYVEVVEHRNTIHGDEMGAKAPVRYTVKEKKFTFETKPVRRYEITVRAGEATKEFEIKSTQVRPWAENLAEIEAFGLPTTKEEADALMEEVTVDVWHLKGEEKIAAKATFTVHKAIAEKVRCIFAEIFEGEEKFPINSIGGYAWRDGKSEHNYGTALDINPNENYCIYKDGTVVGNLYEPYDNPYSITPFGEVVEIFEKYGFNWGADTWSGNRDYMHFSYCGT